MKACVRPLEKRIPVRCCRQFASVGEHPGCDPFRKLDNRWSFKDEAPACATIAHFGRFDADIPMEGVEALIAKAHPTAQIFVYEAGHGFNSDRRKDYHEPSATRARERTLMLFKACGG